MGKNSGRSYSAYGVQSRAEKAFVSLSKVMWFLYMGILCKEEIILLK